MCVSSACTVCQGAVDVKSITYLIQLFRGRTVDKCGRSLYHDITMSVLFFDIDNTLLSHLSFSIPESAMLGLRKAKKKGHLLFLSSGRSIQGLSDYYDPDLFDGLVASSGAVGVVHEKTVCCHAIAPVYIRKMIDLAEEYHIGLFLQCMESSKMNVYGFERLSRILGKSVDVMKQLGMTVMTSFPEEPVVKMDIIFSQDTPVEEILGRIPEGLEVVSLLNPAKNDYGSELTVKGISKGSGILEMMKVLGKDPKDSYGFGDSANDIAMLKECGVGIAMGNAEPIVKEAADYVTSDIEEDGIFNALMHFGLI